MSHKKNSSLRLSSDDLDRLRQESDAIKRLINVNLERKDQLQSALYPAQAAAHAQRNLSSLEQSWKTNRQG